MQDKKLNDPIIDWSVQKNTIPLDAFLEILRAFIIQLSEDKAAITQAYQENNREQLLKLLHSLKGGCKCCGLVRLASEIDHIYKQTQNNSHLEPLLLEKFTAYCNETQKEILKFI